MSHWNSSKKAWSLVWLAQLFPNLMELTGRHSRLIWPQSRMPWGNHPCVQFQLLWASTSFSFIVYYVIQPELNGNDKRHSQTLTAAITSFVKEDNRMGMIITSVLMSIHCALFLDVLFRSQFHISQQFSDHFFTLLYKIFTDLI